MRVASILISNNYFTISRVIYCWCVSNSSRFKYNSSTKTNTSSTYGSYNCCTIVRVATISISNNYFVIGGVICCSYITSISRFKYNFRTKINNTFKYITYNCCAIGRVIWILINNNYFTISRVIYCWTQCNITSRKYRRNTKINTSARYSSNNYFTVASVALISISNNYFTISRVICCWLVCTGSSFEYDRTTNTWSCRRWWGNNTNSSISVNNYCCTIRNSTTCNKISNTRFNTCKLWSVTIVSNNPTDCTYTLSCANSNTTSCGYETNRINIGYILIC